MLYTPHCFEKGRKVYVYVLSRCDTVNDEDGEITNETVVEKMLNEL
jgi:hypothetical protein